jgi:molybdate transport system substrate-binding protein
MTVRRAGALLATVAALTALAACSTTTIEPLAAPASSTTIPQAPTGRVVVLAATPIAPTIDLLGKSFTTAHPGVEVSVTTGSANGLVNQVGGGLVGDVFASVGSPAVDQLALEGHLAVQPLVFARDPLVLVVPPGNPEGLTGIDDLANADRSIALCSLDSACGQASDAALMRAGITASPDVLATDGATVVQAVTTGRAAAGLAYRTDVTASVSFLDLGPDLQAHVPAIAVKLASSTNPGAADAFIAYLFTPEAKQQLATIGLVPPAAEPPVPEPAPAQPPPAG